MGDHAGACAHWWPFDRGIDGLSLQSTRNPAVKRIMSEWKELQRNKSNQLTAHHWRYALCAGVPFRTAIGGFVEPRSLRHQFRWIGRPICVSDGGPASP